MTPASTAQPGGLTEVRPLDGSRLTMRPVEPGDERRVGDAFGAESRPGSPGIALVNPK